MPTVTTMLKHIYKGESKPIIKNVFNLRSCAKIVGAQVLCFNKEEDLLREWKRFIVEV